MLPSLAALHLPRTFFGAGSLATLADELTAHGASRPMLVTDKGLVKAGLVEKLVAACRGSVALTVFDGVTENPLFSDVDSGTQQYVRGACDGVLLSAVAPSSTPRSSSHCSQPMAARPPTLPVCRASSMDRARR